MLADDESRATGDEGSSESFAALLAVLSSHKAKPVDRQESRAADDKGSEESFAALSSVLSSQKAKLRTEERHELWQSQSEARKAKSRKHLLADPAPLASGPKPASMPSSAQYSFGVSRHLCGKLKVPAHEPRDNIFGIPSHGSPGPAASSFAPPLKGMAGDAAGFESTGGWNAADHDKFMHVLASCDGRATQEFFEQASHVLGGELAMPRLAIVDHVRWLAAHEKQRAKTQRRVAGFRPKYSTDSTEQLGPAFSGVLKKSLDLLHDADAEEDRHRLVARRQRQPKAFAATSNDHAGLRKSPNYGFASGREACSPVLATGLSPSQSEPQLRNRGPGSYLGHDATNALLRNPSWSFGTKLPGEQFGTWAADGPGYSGSDHASMQVIRELQATKAKPQGCVFGNGPARGMLSRGSSTPAAIGPGRYAHAMPG